MEWSSGQTIHFVLIQLCFLLSLLKMMFLLMHMDISTSKNEPDELKLKIQPVQTLWCNFDILYYFEDLGKFLDKSQEDLKTLVK